MWPRGHKVINGDGKSFQSKKGIVHTKSLIVGKLLGLHGVIRAEVTNALTCSSICYNRESQLRLASAEA